MFPTHFVDRSERKRTHTSRTERGSYNQDSKFRIFAALAKRTCNIIQSSNAEIPSPVHEPDKATAIMNTSLAPSPVGRKSDDHDLSAVKTLRKALAILDAFARAERPLTVAEVALRTKVTRPTAHRLIQTLIAEGYLAQNSEDGRIAPGYSVLMLASNLLDTSQLRVESLPHLTALARTVNERVSLGILHRYDVLCIAGVEKPSLPTIYSRFGETGSAYCSAIGKALLAYLSPAELADYFEAVTLVRHTERTITDETTLRGELAQIKRDGFAVDRGECLPGSCCVAAPILVHGVPVAAIAIIGRTPEPLLRRKDDVKHAAEVISHVLGRGA